MSCKVEVGDLQIAVVCKGLVGVRHGTAGFEILHPAAHAVKGHGDKCGSGGVGSEGVGCDALPIDWAVLAVVLDLPDAGGGLNQCLVPVLVEQGEELFDLALRRVGDGAPYQCVLIQAVGRVGAVRPEVC